MRILKWMVMKTCVPCATEMASSCGCCVGKDCKRCYHPNCLDPPPLHAPPGVWHCPQCVKKKLLFGVHSVSEGVESIWDSREVEISNAKGVRQRQYLVKYHGLAHIHNHWVPEKQLLLENPHLVSNFIEKDQIVRWNAEWTVPHRLLRKRSIQDKIYIASSDVISVCNNEWLVKWCGLSYDHATWELENAYFLSSSLGQNLMKDYETRRQKAKQEVNKPRKGSIAKLSELPASRSDINDNYMLQNVNKLRECLFKCQNAVVLDDQERAMTVILSIGSMSKIYRPFLIVTASSSLSQWEAEFARLVPSVDVVVYSGNRDSRKGIRSSEFYEEGGVMLQVLLSSAEAVFEDIDILRGIRWKAIVIDEYQHSVISNDLEQIKVLGTDSRILLVNGQIKDTTSEYLKILSLLESHEDYDKLRGLKSETNDNICKLKDRLSHFIAYGSTSQASKFLEYWVPVHLSNYQLELYCDALLSNSVPLRSCLRNDPVGALRDILLTVRKCCDHPYLLDSSMQERLIAEEHTAAAELLDIGIKASGKLQLLDMMLTDIKTRGLQVLVLFQQLSTGPGGTSTGDILDDFLRQRFGQNTYERVDAGVIPSKKQAAVNRFNKKETGQFVFLLENRACSSSIKLSSLDIIVIYDSDWNPANDLRALQKISIDTKVEQIKLFRLYSSFTVEERALVLAKQNLNLNNLQTFSRATSDTLLSWGAICLFNKLDEYHATGSKSTLALNSSSGQLLLNEVTKEFQAILSGTRDNTDSVSVISKVKLGVGRYSANISMLGESKIQLKDGEEPHVFWRNLLDWKNPQWRNLKGPSPRNRKRVHYLDESLGNAETEKDDVVKKRRKIVNEGSDPVLVQVELGAHQGPQVAVSEGGLSTIKACNQSEKLQRDSITSKNIPNSMSSQSSFGAEVSARASKESVVSSDEQKSLCSSLQGEMTRLCQILKLSEDVTLTMGRFLEYVVKNHHVNSDSPSILQAFQISLCWIAASITKQKVDKKDSLMLAKQLLNYQCTEEQVNSVYLKMRSLKRIFLLCSENTSDLGRHCLLAEEDISKEPSHDNEGGSQFSPSKPRNMKMGTGDESANDEHAEGEILLQQKVALKDKACASEIDNKIKKIQKKCDKRMKKLIRKHQEEIQEFHRIWEEKRAKLETDHKLESALIRSIHGQGSVGMEKLKLLDNNFAKKMEEHNLLKDLQLKDLEAEQLTAMKEERQKAAYWLAEAKACTSELRAVNGPQSLGSQYEDEVGGPQPSTCINTSGPGNVLPICGHHLEGQNPSKSFCTQGNDLVPSFASISTPVEAISSEAPVKKLATVNSQNEVGEMSLERSSVAVTEHHQSKHPEAISCEAPDENLATVNLQNEVGVISLERSSVAMAENHQSKHPEAISCEAPNENLATANSQNEVGVKSSVAEHHQSKHSSDNGGTVSANLPASVEQVSVRSVDLSEEFPVEVPKTLPDENVGHVHTEELSNASNEESDKGSKTALSDASVIQRDGPDKAASGCLKSQGQQLVHSEETEALPDSCDLLPHQGQQDKVDQSLVLADKQVLDAPAVENQSTLQIEVATSLLVDTAVENQGTSQIEAPVTDQIVTPVLSNHEAPITEHSEQLDSMSVDVYLSCNLSPAIEDLDQRRSSSQTAEPGATEVLSHKSISQREENLEIHRNHDGLGPVSSVVHEIVTPVQSNHEISVTEHSEHLHSVSVDVSLGCNHSPAIEDHDQRRSSSQTAEAGGAEVLSHESISQHEGNLEIHGNDHGLGPVNSVAHEQSVELPAVSQNDVALPQAVVRTAEQPNQAVQPLGIGAEHLHGQSYFLVHPIHQPTSWNSNPSLLADPLQNELERIRKETEQLEKNHGDMMSQLRSDCEKEIQEIITQIRNKYEMKRRESEDEFRLRKNELDKNQNKVLMNKILAEAFRSKCLDLRPSGLPGVQQGVPSSFMQHLHQVSQPPPMRPPTRASPHLPVPGQQQITAPAVPAIPQLSRPQSLRSTPVPSQSVTAPPVQAVQHAAALFSGTSPRPPLISAITPAVNPRVGGEIRAPAPHLQPFRPASIPATTPPSISQLRPQQVLPSQHVPPPPPPPQVPNLVLQNRPERPGDLSAPPNPSLSTLGLLVDMDHRPSVPDNRTSSRLPDICSTFQSLELSDLEILGNGQGDQTSAVATDVVCLSDDD